MEDPPATSHLVYNHIVIELPQLNCRVTVQILSCPLPLVPITRGFLIRHFICQNSRISGLINALIDNIHSGNARFWKLNALP